jgi:glutathione S-transferase
MDLYVFRPSSSSRAVLAFCEAAGVRITIKDVDISRGEHHRPAFSTLNPSRLVPVLDDDGFVLTQSSAIVRYLATKAQSPLYPEDARVRARVDELLAWFEADFAKDYIYQFVYPQILAQHARGSDEATRRTVEWGRDKSRAWLSVLDGHFLAGGKRWLVGDGLTLADLFGASIISLGELVGCVFEGFPNVRRWYDNVTNQPSWLRINDPFKGYAASIGQRQFVRLT